MRASLKPWGYEVILERSPAYTIKLIHINEGHRLSLQYHRRKVESIYVLFGHLTLIRGRKKEMVFHGETRTIKPGTLHRFCAPSMPVELLEVSVGSDGDIVRLQDDYGRTRRINR